MSQKTALIMAGGTGGHIFPGLAVAEELRARGWRVHWLGAPGSMESRIVPQHGFALELIDFSGVRGKGLVTLALLPLRLLRAFWQALQVVRRVKPDVVVGLGGYITFPGGMMGVLCGKPLVLHEQNSVAGMANKVLAGVADRVFTAFPNVFKKAQWVGNPLRTAFTRQAAPAERFAGRTGPLRLLVVGGSLGARALNEIVPQALALIPPEQRPVVTPPKRGHADRCLARQLRGRWRAGRVDPVHRRHGQCLCPRRHHRLPRRGQHRDRNCRRGCRGHLCAIPFGGGRPPDHQRPVSGGRGRRLAGAAKRPDPRGLGAKCY
jgi:UDP-N-acetylglucosamine:LPS N-acetylglucosamine transferase